MVTGKTTFTTIQIESESGKGGIFDTSGDVGIDSVDKPKIIFQFKKFTKLTQVF